VSHLHIFIYTVFASSCAMTFNPSSKFSCSSRTFLYAMIKAVFQGWIFLGVRYP